MRLSRISFFLLTVISFTAIFLFTRPIFKLLLLMPEISGFRGEKTYLVLLQNHTELRPTGGFMGSYALITIENAWIKDMLVQDIYEPDGKVTEHIKPPEPIQEAFQLGTWRLRDANWEADFFKAAQTVGWFFAKGGVKNVDGVVATNLIVFEKLVSLLGPIALLDYQEVITSENLWQLTQQHSQEGFFPGSKQKREFLVDLAGSVLQKFQTAPLITKVKAMWLARRMLEEKQLMVYSADSVLQRAFEKLCWAGRVKQASCPWWSRGCVRNSLLVVEANLGVNKANCCLERKALLEIDRREAQLHHRLTIMYRNNSQKLPHKAPLRSVELRGVQWGGDYKAWVRVYSSVPAEEEGFWVDVPVGEERKYLFEYDLPIEDGSPRLISLLIQKQSGIEFWPLRIVYRGEENQYQIKKDSQIYLR